MSLEHRFRAGVMTEEYPPLTQLEYEAGMKALTAWVQREGEHEPFASTDLSLGEMLKQAREREDHGLRYVTFVVRTAQERGQSPIEYLNPNARRRGAPSLLPLAA